MNRPRAAKPTCDTCGWEIPLGACYRTELHWTVCRTCHVVIDFDRTCPNGCTGRGTAAVESLIADGLIARAS